MPCVPINRGIVCGFNPMHKLRLADGTRVFMEWHRYCGPFFFKDKACNREFVDWHEYPLVVDALNWFIDRGNRS